jgi:hypothetical protein
MPARIAHGTQVGDACTAGELKMSTAMPTDTITKIARRTRSAMIGRRAGREEISRETDESDEVYQRPPGGGAA